MTLTVLIIKGKEGLIGTIKEIPAVITQGETREELMENIKDALELYLEDMRAEKDLPSVIGREELVFA